MITAPLTAAPPTVAPSTVEQLGDVSGLFAATGPGHAIDLAVTRLDGTTAAQVRGRLHDAIDALRGDGSELIVDVAAVESVDAVGLGVLMGAHQRAARRGVRLRLRSVSPRVARTLLATRHARVSDEQLRQMPTQRRPRQLVHRFG